jgi:uncharacterized protein (TIGR02118 family)
VFKRMSVLVRRASDDRAYFSRKWEAHAAPVSKLPKVRGYIQNHVVEAFTRGPGSPIEADGFVELLWDRAEDMAAAFASPAARPMVEDEPGFLGHGSGYALAAAPRLREATGGKLIVAVVTGDDRSPLDALEKSVRTLDGLEHLIRDEVTSLIPKPGMAPPQPVDAFFHLYFGDADKARRAGEAVAAGRSEGRPRLGVYGVRTVRFV